MLSRYLRSRTGQTEFLKWLAVTLLVLFVSLVVASLAPWKLSSNFVSDASGFAAAVVSLAVPLGLDVLGRFSEKYGSSRPMRFFVPHLRIVPVILSVFVLVFSAVVLKAGDWVSPPAWLIWFNLFAFGIMAVQFYLFLSAIVRFVVWEPAALIDEMAATIANETY